MRVLVLADVFFPDTVGGAGRVAYHLGLGLSNAGHDVHVVTRNPAGRLPAFEFLDNRLSVHRFHFPSKESPGSFLSEITNSLLVAERLAGENPFDLICAHQPLASAGPLLSRTLRRVPLCYYFHSPWHEEFLIKKRDSGGLRSPLTGAAAQWMKAMERRLLKRADMVVVLSRYMRDRVLEIHRLPGRRLRIIPGGVDLDRFHPPRGGRDQAKAALDLPAGRTVFLTVRNLVPRMGLEALISAFAGSGPLRKNGCLLLGGKGPLEGSLKTMVRDLALEECVLFLGHIPERDLPGMYQAADFSVLPTRDLEGFGLVILESMACGTPVLGTPVGAIPEVIGAFDKRLIFTGTGWREMRDRLEEIILEPRSHYFSPSDCRSYVEDNFSWKRVADLFEMEALRLLK